MSMITTPALGAGPARTLGGGGRRRGPRGSAEAQVLPRDARPDLRPRLPGQAQRLRARPGADRRTLRRPGHPPGRRTAVHRRHGPLPRGPLPQGHHSAGPGRSHARPPGRALLRRAPVGQHHDRPPRRTGRPLPRLRRQLRRRPGRGEIPGPARPAARGPGHRRDRAGQGQRPGDSPAVRPLAGGGIADRRPRLLRHQGVRATGARDAVSGSRGCPATPRS